MYGIEGIFDYNWECLKDNADVICRSNLEEMNKIEGFDLCLLVKYLMFVDRVGLSSISEFIDEVIEGWDDWLETLSGSDSLGKDERLGSFLEWVGSELLPMVEHTLWEGTSRGGSSEGLGESKGLSDWKVSLEVDKWGSLNWILTNNHTSSLGETLVNSTDGIIWALDLNEEDWLLESWGSSELRGVEDSSGGWDDLTTSSVNSISVEGNILDVESNTSHLLVSQDSLFGGPLEGSLHGILDLMEILDSLGGINQHVWTSGLWTEAPNLLGVVWIPVIVVSELSVSDLWILLGADLVFLNGIGKFVSEWGSLTEDSVMLVW